MAIFGGNVHSEGYTGRRRNTADIKILSFGLCRLLPNNSLTIIIIWVYIVLAFQLMSLLVGGFAFLAAIISV